MTALRQALARHGIETAGDWAAVAMLVVFSLALGVLGAVWFA
jgi:hypothetical protein